MPAGLGKEMTRVLPKQFPKYGDLLHWRRYKGKYGHVRWESGLHAHRPAAYKRWRKGVSPTAAIYDIDELELAAEKGWRGLKPPARGLPRFSGKRLRRRGRFRDHAPLL
jgi:hypothetical protein